MKRRMLFVALLTGTLSLYSGRTAAQERLPEYLQAEKFT